MPTVAHVSKDIKKVPLAVIQNNTDVIIQEKRLSKYVSRISRIYRRSARVVHVSFILRLK